MRKITGLKMNRYFITLLFAFNIFIVGENIKTLHTVVVILEAKVGCEQELEQLLLETAVLSRLEKSCFIYNVHSDLSNTSQFVLYEQWQSKEDHQIYHKKLADKGMVIKLQTLLAKPRTVIFSKQLEPKNLVV